MLRMKKIMLSISFFSFFIIGLSAQTLSDNQDLTSIKDLSKKEFLVQISSLSADFQKAVSEDFDLLNEEQKKELVAFSKRKKSHRGLDSTTFYKERLDWAVQNLREETYAKLTRSNK